MSRRGRKKEIKSHEHSSEVKKAREYRRKDGPFVIRIEPPKWAEGHAILPNILGKNPERR